MERMMKIFAWIPVLNLLVIVISLITYIKSNNIKKMILPTAIWIGLMLVSAIIRAVITVIFAKTAMSVVVDIVTYSTLYLSITLGALAFLKKW